MLLWALNPHNPYGYDILLRWVCGGVFAYSFFQVLALGDEKQGWAWVFGITALIYNPIFRVHLNRELWQILNIAAVVILVASIFMFKIKKQNSTGVSNAGE